jgi:dTDP-L-rhamnose 4-epimerase
MSTTSVLITGGAGFIGSRLARRLARDGHRVTVLDNLHPQVHGPAGEPPDLPGCEFIRADVRDAEAVARAAAGAEIVYHLAAETGVGQSQYEIGRYVSVNTYGTAVALEASAAAGARQFVVASSRAVYGEGRHRCAACEHEFAARGRSTEEMDAGRWDVPCPRCRGGSEPLPMAEDDPPAPISIYGVTKLQQEQLARAVSEAHGLKVTALRFFNVYGPGQSLSNPYVGVLGTFFRRATAGETVEVYEDGRMLRDFVFVEDVVESLRLCAGDERAYGRTLNVGTGEAVTLLQVAEEIFRALSLEPKVTVSGRYRLGDIRHAVADQSALSSALDYKPKTTFAEGVRAFVGWAAANPAEAGDAAAERELAARNLLRRGAR